jgi:PAS domain S-box-containing protein
MDPLQTILDSHESWLTHRVTSYLRQSEDFEDPSPLNETWRLSVADLSSSLAKAIPALLDHHADQRDSLMEYVVLEAQRHRERGMRLSAFLSLFKHYRQAYHDLFGQIPWEPLTRAHYRLGLHKCMDRAEIRFCEEWTTELGEATARLHHAERDLERKNEFLTTVLESLTHPFMVMDTHDFSVSLSNSASGIRPGLDRPKCYEISHGRSQPCDGLEYACPVKIVTNTGNAALVEHEHHTADRGVRFVEIHAYPVLDRNSDVTQVIQYMVDITQRKTAEVALRESEQKLDGILASITDHLIMTDSDYRIIWTNDVAKGLFGSDLCGKRCHEVLCARLTPCDECAIVDCMADGRPHDREQTVILPNQETVHLWCTTNVATRHDDGRPKTFVKILRDVTALKKTQELLLQTEGLRAISELTTGVAHNFRNLLQVIMSAARLASMEMKDNNLNEADLALEQILRTSYFGAGTIKRLEEFAKPASELRLKPDAVFDLSVTVAQAIEMSKPWWKAQPQRRGITIQVQHELEQGAWVKGQEGELFEVIVNLLRNAVESFSGDGIITVKTSVTPPQVCASVQDTGSGITARSLRNVFEPFWTTKFGRGSGMGLATSQRIVMNHQGSISVQSAPGKGSTFTLRLPLATNLPENREPDSQEEKERALNILVIDDVEQAANFLSKALARKGHRVESSSSGEEGLSCFQRSDFDAVLCDLCMPGMNGLEVGRKVKDICLERGVKKPAFVLITGWTDQELREKEMEDSGIDGRLEKPSDLHQIQELLTRVIRKRRREAEKT